MILVRQRGKERFTGAFPVANEVSLCPLCGLRIAQRFDMPRDSRRIPPRTNFSFLSALHC
jgi:hypothetical protein